VSKAEVQIPNEIDAIGNGSADKVKLVGTGSDWLVSQS
jgi:hypothetical protein